MVQVIVCAGLPFAKRTGTDRMTSTVVKRSIIIRGHKTSVSIEEPFWTGLKEIATARQYTLGKLVAEIDEHRQAANLSSAIRLFVLQHYQERAQQALR